MKLFSNQSHHVCVVPLIVVFVIPILFGSGASRAEPNVVHFEPSESIRLTDYDPDAPDLSLYIGNYYAGGGSGIFYWYPHVHGFGHYNPWANGLVVELNIGVANGSYELLPGSTVSSATPGSWFVDYPEFGWTLPTLATTSYSGGDCWYCHTVFVFDHAPPPTIPPGVKYVAFRWYSGSEVRYGWVAFRFDLLEYPDGCREVSDTCPDSIYDSSRIFQFRYLAVGYESEPDSPITVGGGLCRTDLNFDARIDFFDFATFLSLYAADDQRADFSGDGLLNFFDFAVFIRELGEVCEL